MWTITMVVATFLLGPEAFLNSSNTFSGIFSKRLSPHDPLGDGSAEDLPSLVEILHLRTVGSRPVEGSSSYFLVRNRYVKAGPEALELLLVKFFLLVGYVLALPRFPQAVTLYGLCENHRGGTGVLNSRPCRRRRPSLSRGLLLRASQAPRLCGSRPSFRISGRVPKKCSLMYFPGEMVYLW